MDRSKPSLWDSAISGAASGVITRAVVSPLDLLKIRFQLQVSEPGNAPRYRHVLSSFPAIVREEGIKGLWKGHIPAQLLSFTYGAAHFCSYEALMKCAGRSGSGAGSKYRAANPGVTFLCGGLAGCCASLVAQPLDVLRTRLVAQTTADSKVYTSIPHAIRHMLTTEGPASFYRGLTPTLVLVFPQGGLQFSIYHGLSRIWRMALGDQSVVGFPRSSACGMVAGVVSKLAVLPLDLVKKRLQVQGYEHTWASLGRTVKYTSMADCIRQVWRTEGTLAFYKGAAPSLLKAGVSVALIFTSYEWCLDLLCHIKATRTTE